MSFTITKIVLDPECRDNLYAEEIIEKSGLKPLIMTKDELLSTMQHLPEKELFQEAKTTLFLTTQKGRFLKKCPGSRGVVCCNYYTINSVTGCPFDCSYCILQHYIKNNPFITIFLNREDIFTEIQHHLRQKEHIRVGTGELADSLALDHLLDESGFFINEIESRGLADHITFEFKTKSAQVETLIRHYTKHPETDIVAGFSVNLDCFRKSDELSTAPMKERLDAVQRVVEAGMKISIHFDPVIMLEQLKNDYLELIDTIFSRFKPDQIAWISMGGFRHTLSLTQTIRERFGSSILLQGEMFPSDQDNKLRYLAPVRTDFYKEFNKRIRSHHPHAPLYICMDKGFIWQRCNFDLSRLSREELSHIFG